MSNQFNADEIFEMAKRIESNGSAFYRKAADMNSEWKDLLLEIAEQEDIHLATFKDMQKELTTRETEPMAFDPYEEADMYLKAMADGHVFDTGKDPSEILGDVKDPGGIIDFALGMEKDSIVFYVGLKEFMPRIMGPEKVQEIISEEMKHIVWLNNCLRKIKG